MSSDDSSARSASPIVLRIKLRYDDVEVMVQRFATNVGKSGLFLPTKSIQPIGSEIKFELRLADDTPVLVGLGRVKLARPPDPNHPRATFGMAIELMRVTPQSRALILRMLEQRRALGLPELGLPTPEDIDAARRAEVVAGRDTASGPIPVVSPAGSAASGSTVVPVVAPPSRSAGVSIDPHPGEALLTAPRRTTGPLAIAKVLAVAPLAPEPPRRKRVAVSEIIDSASGPVASVAMAVPGLDDDVDVAAALARARSLAGGEVEAELEALCESAAAPSEISVEAASAELARQLGGSAVRRDRSARWAPPPATKLPEPAEAAEDDARESPTDRNDRRADTAAAEVPATAEPHELELHELEPDDAEPDDAEPDDAQPEPLADVIHPLSELDMEDVEHTEAGGIPVPAGMDPHAFAGEPSGVHQARLTEQLEAELAEAEAEAEAENLELARALGLASHGDPAEAYEHRADLDVRTDSAVDVNLDEIEDFEIIAETDADQEDGVLAERGDAEAPDHGDEIAQQPTGVRRRSTLDFAAQLDLGDDSDAYYAPHGEAEFADRHAHLDSAGQALAAFDDDDDDDVLDDPDSGGFTLAGAPSAAPDLELPPAPAPVSQRRSQATVGPAASEPRSRRLEAVPVRKQPSTLRNSPFLPSLLDSPVEDHELESALEALDVDLDDLAIPHAATELQRDPNRQHPTTLRPPLPGHTPPIKPHARASLPMPSPAARPSASALPPAGRAGAPRAIADDGALLDFEDDE